mmetsp:Transcript_13922/g.30227  ORF Transcript_13922/g.30227 Transcript_13922/m.30227 type:complete len:205 (+) Transcript_13922:3-617(+)
MNWVICRAHTIGPCSALSVDVKFDYFSFTLPSSVFWCKCPDFFRPDRSIGMSILDVKSARPFIYLFLLRRKRVVRLDASSCWASSGISLGPSNGLFFAAVSYEAKPEWFPPLMVSSLLVFGNFDKSRNFCCCDENLAILSLEASSTKILGGDDDPFSRRFGTPSTSVPAAQATICDPTLVIEPSCNRIEGKLDFINSSVICNAP